MEGKTLTDCQGDAADTAFTSADKIRFCSLTYEIIEELRLRRELASENEKKIEKLINDRFAMGWKLDQESGKVANLGERHEAELRETRRQLEEKMRDCQVEASQQQVYRKMAEKEKEALKEEIRRLQLANYSLEKKVRESEHQEKIQANEREQHIRQVSRFESSCGQLDGMIKQLTAKQEQIDRDMKVVQNLNRSLQYQNSHQKCVLDMKEADLANLRQQLLDTQVKVKIDPTRVKEREEEFQAEVRRLKTLVGKLEGNNSSLEEDKDSWKKKYWESLKKIDEAHRHVNVHLHNAARYRDECAGVEKLQKATQDKLDDTENRLKQTREELVDNTEKHKKQKAILVADVEKLNSEKHVINFEVHSLVLEKEHLEKRLKNADDSIIDLTSQLQCAMSVLNREKIHVECQTQLHMLHMMNMETQANPELQNKESQIQVDVCEGVTQTIDPALCSTEAQTYLQVFVSSGVQTDNATFKATEVQVDNSINIKDAVTQTEEYKKDTECQKKETPVITDGKDNANNTSHSSRQKTPSSQECETVVDGSRQEKSQNMEVVQDFNCMSNGDASNCREEFANKKRTDVYNLTMDEGTVHIGNTSSNDLADTVVVQVGSNNTFSRNETLIIIDEGSLKSKESVDGIKYAHEERLDGKLQNEMFKFKSCNKVDKMSKEDEKGKRFGQCIPKIDVVKNIRYPATVSIDPEEFNIELTQDEKTTDKDNLKEVDNYPCSLDDRDIFTAKADQMDDFDIPKEDAIHEHNKIDKAIEKNWEVSEEQMKTPKAKSRKHKLTKETVKDQFSSFDMNKQKFEKSLFKEEVQAKQLKLIDEQSCKKNTKKKRNYMSMFQTESQNERGDNFLSGKSDRGGSLALTEQERQQCLPVGDDDDRNSRKGITEPTDSCTASSSPNSNIDERDTVPDPIKITCRTATALQPCADTLRGPSCISKSSDHKQVESKTDFLQKYKDIVAKIKPMHHGSSNLTTKGIEKTREIGKDSPRTFHLPDFSRKVSPRGGTPKSILKGANRKEQKTRNVTWNEYVKARDIVNDESTPEDN